MDTVYYNIENDNLYILTYIKIHVHICGVRLLTREVNYIQNYIYIQVNCFVCILLLFYIRNYIYICTKVYCFIYTYILLLFVNTNIYTCRYTVGPDNLLH